MTANTHYDFIIIGTGAGGGTLARELAPTGKRILILERGDFLPREKENWDPVAVYQNSRYYTDAEKWIDKSGEPFDPQTCYWVGGNTKVYGAALLRMRERDFDAVEPNNFSKTDLVYQSLALAIDRKCQDYICKYTEQKLCVGSVLFDRSRKVVCRSENALLLLPELC